MTRIALLCLALAAPALAAPSGARRLALIAGADDGGEGRARLRYAASDARAVAAVLRELGGVDEADLQLVVEPSRAALSSALAALPARVAAARRTAERVEVVVYYSGHSDEDGLLLSGELLPYDSLRAALDSAGADVRLAIVDSCSAGALTRSKGGVARPAFLLDSSREVRGRAILTSTSADEAAQESDRIGGSFFTHYLVSGMRGAADTSRSGRVTLGDAYRFAFAETLARTQSTRAGPQHPAYDIALNGSGDLVLTDLHAAGSTLVLPAALSGRVFVRDSSDRLVVELRKPAGDDVRLGLSPGTYRVAVESDGSLRESQVQLARGEERPPASFTPVQREEVASRGPAQVRPLAVNVSLFPPASVNALFDYRTVNLFALDLVVGNAAGLEGVQISAVGSRNGAVRGAQIAGAFNWVDGAYGQSGDASAIQIAGALNWASGSLTGAQVAGAFNRAGPSQGLQIAGGANLASSLRGAQVAGGLNLADSVDGVQVASVNVARTVSGVQVGAINVAEDADYTIGAFSWVSRGTHNAAAGATEYGSLLEADTGGRIVYGILSGGAAFRFRSQPQRYLLGGGIGWHAFSGERASVDVQALSFQLVDSDAWTHRQLSVARAVANVKVAGPLELFAGPTFNVLVDQEPRKVDFAGYGWAAGDVRMWPGFLAGLRLAWPAAPRFE